MPSPADDLRALLAEQFDDGDGGWLKEHAAAVLLDAAQVAVTGRQSHQLAAALCALTEPRP